MATSDRHFRPVTCAIFAAAAAAALAVAALAHQPDLGAGSIALSIGTAPPMPEASRERHADQPAVNQLAVFLLKGMMVRCLWRCRPPDSTL